MVTQQVERDRVEPCLLACATRIERPAGAEHALEGLGQEVLGQGTIARPVDQEGQKRLGVILVQALEALATHYSNDRQIRARRNPRQAGAGRGRPFSKRAKSATKTAGANQTTYR